MLTADSSRHGRCSQLHLPAKMVGLEEQNDQVPRSLQELVRPHVDSFDHFLSEGLQAVVELLKPVEVKSQLFRHSSYHASKPRSDLQSCK